MEPTLSAVDDDLWVSHFPELRFLGVPVGSRMSVVRLGDGKLWVYSPIPLTDALRGAVEDLGPVSHIVAPNLYHHLYAGDWKAAFPDAKLYGVHGLGKKRPDLELEAEFDDASHPDWQGLRPLSVRGTMLGETLFFHQATRSIIASDLLENFSSCNHWLTKAYLTMGGIYQKPGVHYVMRLAFRDRALARTSIDRLLELDFQRAIVAHGDILNEDAKETVRATYQWLSA